MLDLKKVSFDKDNRIKFYAFAKKEFTDLSVKILKMRS
jgi:hypothetical protein